jgi:hypothetical protein
VEAASARRGVAVAVAVVGEWRRGWAREGSMRSMQCGGEWSGGGDRS